MPKNKLKNENLIINVQSIILALLLFVVSQGMIYGQTHRWPFMANLGMIFLNIAVIALTGYLIFKQDKTQTRIQQYYYHDIHKTFENTYSIVAIILTTVLCLASEYAINYFFPSKTDATNVALIAKGIDKSQPFLLTATLLVLIYAIITPIIEELLYRQLLPMLLPHTVSFFVIGGLFVLLHAPNNTQQIVTLAIATGIFLIHRIRYNIIQAIIVHQILNLFSIYELINYLR